jgi:hypothetical protein
VAAADLAQRVRAARSAVDREAGEARAVGLAGKAAQERAETFRGLIEQHERVIGVLTRVGEENQQRAQAQIEGLVTRGLQTIFGENLSFHVIQGQRANQATVEFVIRSSYPLPKEQDAEGDFIQVIETSVMDARGGGMAAVVGFILRLVVLLLTPGARRVLVLDETFAHVSEEYVPRLAEFLREVADKAGVQLFLITHSNGYGDAADREYRFELGPDGRTIARDSAELAAPARD